jgi:DNA-binding PadR family transcriptional regulator
MRAGFYRGRSPWGPWAAVALGSPSRFFEFGEVRLAVLSLLAEGPKHGYQLIKELQERSGGLYRASAGTIYPTLAELDDEGLITSERVEGKRVYRITPEGRKELENDPEAVHRIWSRAERWEDWGNCMRPEAFSLLGPAGALFKAALYAAGRAGGRPEREQQIRDILDRANGELSELQKQWKERP